jgi:hypothetical protein
MNTSPLPITRSLNPVTVLSLLVALLMTVLSTAGFVNPSGVYPSVTIQEAFLANDVVNLLVGLPILLGSIWLSRRGVLIGLLLWPGALLYTLYNYIAYLFGMPFRGVALAYLVIVLLSAYTVFDLLRIIDKETVHERLSGGVPRRFAGWVLFSFGVLFFGRAIGLIVQANINQTAISASELGVLIADIVLSALWIAGGVSLLRRKSLGYVGGLGLLFAASMLFVGLLLFILLQPVLTGKPFVAGDLIAVFMMSLICFIPFGLFVRAVLVKGNV